jgi:hypothetical protein
MDLIQDNVRKRTFIFSLFDIHVLLPQDQLFLVAEASSIVAGELLFLIYVYIGRNVNSKVCGNMNMNCGERSMQEETVMRFNAAFPEAGVTARRRALTRSYKGY